LALGAVADNPSGRRTRGLSPLESNVRTAVAYIDPEVAQELPEGAGVRSQQHFDAGRSQGPKASASYGGVGVRRAHHHPAKTHLKQSWHTGWGLLARVAARLQRNIQGGLRQELRRLYSLEGYDFCVRSAKDPMIPFAQDLFSYGDDGAHRGVRFYGGGGSPPC